jgi:DNA-directed RNA polymerase subunit E'/Rpb7
MFEVVLCRDQLPLPYHRLKFGDDGLMTIDPQILGDVITHRFNDRVQLNVGLLVELYDIVRAYECKSLPDISVAYVTVVFRYIVFNPPPGSCWQGIIASCTNTGIWVTLTFFKDIFIPAINLPDGSEFDDAQEVWKWSSADDQGGEPISFVFARTEIVRFRVCEVKFQPENENQLMLIIASMDSRTSGLGPISWWATPEDE